MIATVRDYPNHSSYDYLQLESARRRLSYFFSVDVASLGVDCLLDRMLKLKTEFHDRGEVWAKEVHRAIQELIENGIVSGYLANLGYLVSICKTVDEINYMRDPKVVIKTEDY